jgi:hypothetical protein
VKLIEKPSLDVQITFCVDVRWKSAVAAKKARIMYIECKAGSLQGPARIGRVTYSKSGRTLYYAGCTFVSLDGQGFKANYLNTITNEEYWISGPKKRGGDRLYATGSVEVDEDVRDEYWTEIRGLQRVPGEKLK